MTAAPPGGLAPGLPAHAPRPDGVLTIEDLTVSFPTASGPVRAVRGLSLGLAPGEVLAMVGESGSGKTVTALAVMGLLGRAARVRGSIRYQGTELLGLTDREYARLRGRAIALVPQDPLAALDPVYRVEDQIAEGVRAHARVGRREARRRAVDLLSLVGIADPAAAARRYPHELSGGMRQRVLLAMAIANRPGVLIADEPTTALDVTMQAQILERLARVRDETGAAILLITHDLGVVAGMADRVLIVYAGRVVESGPVEEVFSRPRMPYTVGLLRALPGTALAVAGALGGAPVGAERREGRLVPIPGGPPSPTELPGGCPFAPRCPLVEPACREAEPALEPVLPEVPQVQVHAVACRRAGAVGGLVG